MIFERKTKKRLEIGSVKSDLDETLSELLHFFQILMWYQPYGLKSTNKGVNEETKIKNKKMSDFDEKYTILEELFSGI